MSIRQSRRPLALRQRQVGASKPDALDAGEFTQPSPTDTVRTESRITELPTDTPPELADR